MFTVCCRGRDFRERAAAGAVTISGEALAAVAPTLPRWRGVYRRAFSKAFAADVPYAVGYVQLDDGPRLYGTMVGELDSLEVGQHVTAVFDPVTPEVTLVHWATSPSADPARVAKDKTGSVTGS